MSTVFVNLFQQCVIVNISLKVTVLLFKKLWTLLGLFFFGGWTYEIEITWKYITILVIWTVKTNHFAQHRFFTPWLGWSVKISSYTKKASNILFRIYNCLCKFHWRYFNSYTTKRCSVHYFLPQFYSAVNLSEIIKNAEKYTLQLACKLYSPTSASFSLPGYKFT